MTAHCDSEPQFKRQPTSRQPSYGKSDRDNKPGVTLALGGGFSRGFAHLGVLEVLRQESVRVEAIVGTSIGALLGAAYSEGISLRDLCDLGRSVRVRDFLRFHHSEDGDRRMDRIGQFVRDWFRTTEVELLPIPTAIVTTDLDTGTPYVFTSGPLEVAIRASCAFPGLIKPVEYKGRQLADGCVVAPVPTAIAAKMYRGCVLGVNVGSNSESDSSPVNAVKVVDPACNASVGDGLESSWSANANILLEPLVHHIDWRDFSRVDEAFAAGAEAMRRALPFLRECLTERPRMAPALGSSFHQGWELAL